MTSMLWQNPLADGEEEITTKVEQVLQGSNLAVRPIDGKIAAQLKSITTETPWIHFNHTTARHCGIWNRIYCRQFQLIPYFCRFHCWKTVVKPRTVKELFSLHDLMQGLNYPSKCGIDVRDYTPGPYAAFVYGDSLKEGQMYCAQMQKYVSENISPDIPVFLKRGCTEMEVMKPSDQWDPYTPEEEMLERKLNDIFVKEETDAKQAYWLRNRIMRRWIRHAMSIGDETWKELAGEVNGMHPHVVQYQNTDAFEKTKSVESPIIAKEV
jgi:hypothetical protein